MLTIAIDMVDIARRYIHRRDRYGRHNDPYGGHD